MKKIAYLLLACVLQMVISCSTTLAPIGHYQDSPVISDGNSDDWQAPLRFANKEYTVSYNITNDKKNIYVIVNSKNEEMQRRILTAGLTIYFDPKGESSKKILLTYPEKKVDLPNQSGGMDSMVTKRLLIFKSDTYHTEGFLHMENGEFGVKDKKTKIQLGLRASQDTGLVYEAIIPITYFLENGLVGKALKKNFSVGIEVHSDPAAKRNNTGYNNRSASSGMQPRISMGGMGGMRGGGMGRGGMRGGQSNTNQQQDANRSTTEVLWYQFRFATAAEKP